MTLNIMILRILKLQSHTMYMYNKNVKRFRSYAAKKTNLKTLQKLYTLLTNFTENVMHQRTIGPTCS